jgi:hypothetical protein
MKMIKEISRIVRYLAIIGCCALGFATIVATGGGGGGGNDGNPNGESPELFTTTQEYIPIQEFEQAVVGDVQLQEVVDALTVEEGPGVFSAAGILADQTGAELLLGIFSPDSGGSFVVIQHCLDGDCLSARQNDLAGADDIEWVTLQGPVPVRGMCPPLLLRIFTDPSDPNGSSKIAPLEWLQNSSASESGPEPYLSEVDGVSEQTLFYGDSEYYEIAATVNRRFRVLSAHGSWYTNNYEFLDLATVMRNNGFQDSQQLLNAEIEDLDKELKTMRPVDALAIFGHGDLSESRRRVVGMSMAWNYWLSDHCSETRMLEKLAANPNKGPGILFFCGCQTGDLVPQFDKPSRIVLGISSKSMTAVAVAMLKYFFQYFAEGLTLGEAVDKVNAEYAWLDATLVLNSRAYRRIRLSEVGDFNRPGCWDNCIEARNDECDDGGFDSQSSLCSYGSDCFDCGPRPWFDGEWHSTRECSELEPMPYRWRWAVGLDQDEKIVSGLIYFHKCPGGGQVAYWVSGEATMEEFVVLEGTKVDGRGALYVNSPDQVRFRVVMEAPPEPNLAP